MKKKTLIIGATTNTERYAYLAAKMLTEHGHEIVNVGIKKGSVFGVEIEDPGIIHNDIHTVTLYIGPKIQIGYYDYILKTRPQRVIFNPGTENRELVDLLTERGIHCLSACTLVLLSTGQY